MSQKNTLLLAFKSFDRNGWLLMGLLFFVKAGFFITVPYFSFYLYYRGYSPIEIGIVAAAGPLVSSILNVWSGFLTDKFGKKRAMVCAYFVLFLANLGIAWGDGFWLYLSMNIVLRLADATFGGAMHSYTAGNFSKEVQHIVFHFRFMIINAAAAIGPIVGAFFAMSHSKVLFSLSALISLIGSIMLMIFFKTNKDKSKKASQEEKLTLAGALNVLRRDRSLFWITCSFFLYWIAYIQLDTTLAQILAREFPKDSVFLFAMIWVINTVVIVVGQLPIAHLTRKLPHKQLTWTSSLLLLTGFWVVANFISMWGLAIGIFLVTLGEILLSPLGNVWIAEIAPEKLRATYFGGFSLSFLGAGVGPIIGSFCLTFMSSRLLFTLIGALFFIVIYCLNKVVR
jgi:MFS family permease